MTGNNYNFPNLRRTTVSFVQVRLDVVSIISSAYPGLSSGLDQHRQTLVLNIYLYQKPGSGYGLDVILMPHLHKALTLAEMAKRHYRKLRE